MTTNPTPDNALALADPPGLAEAIEAAEQALLGWFHSSGDLTKYNAVGHQDLVENDGCALCWEAADAAVRAAGTTLVRATLLGAADELDAADMPPGHIGMCNSAWLRCRADRVPVDHTITTVMNTSGDQQ